MLATEPGNAARGGKAVGSSLPWLVAAAVVVSFGVAGGPFTLTVGATTLIWIVLASGLNLAMGYGGLANMGIGATYGIGAYAAGLIATRAHLPLPVAAIVAVVTAGTVAAIIAPLVLRTRGLHFAIATLAIGIVATDLFTNLTGLTGGPVGLAGIERPSALSSPRGMYWFLALAAGVLLSLCALYHRSRIAIVLRGTRDDEQLTRSLGYRATTYKIVAFVLASAVSGLAGMLYAYYIQYLSPDQFALGTASFQAFAIVAFGGGGTVWGPPVAAILLTGVPAFVNMSPQAKLVAYGVALLIVVLAVPEGVVPGARRLARQAIGRRSRLNRPRTQPHDQQSAAASPGHVHTQGTDRSVTPVPVQSPHPHHAHSAEETP